MTSTRILGIDPGLNRTGWGIVDCEGNRLRHVAHGAIVSKPEEALAARLAALYAGLVHVVAEYLPDEAAVEEVFVNKNPSSTLKLGMARGIALLVPATGGLKVAEYSANLIKKSVVGTGHADKEQVAMMVARILPGSNAKADAADALAVAVCHAHHRASLLRVATQTPHPSSESFAPREPG